MALDQWKTIRLFIHYSLFWWFKQFTVWAKAYSLSQRFIVRKIQSGVLDLYPCKWVNITVITSACFTGWLCSTVGRTSVLGRRAFTVLRSTCSWRVTFGVGKPFAAGQPTRPTQPFIFSGSNKLSNEQLYRMCAGSAIWWVLTRLSQVRFINRLAPFVACRLPLNPFAYSAASCVADVSSVRLRCMSAVK